MIESVQDLLDVTVQLAPWRDQDQYGRAVYGATKTVLARVEQGAFAELGPNGQAIVARYKVILGEALAVDVRDQLTLPAAFGARAQEGAMTAVTPNIYSVRTVYYQGRHDHTVLICG